MCSTHHYYYHCTKYTAILSVTVRNTFLTAPRIRLFVSFFVLNTHTQSWQANACTRGDTLVSAHCTVLVWFLSCFLSLFLRLLLYARSRLPLLPVNYNMKPKFAENRRTNETAASRTNARLCAYFARNLLIPREALAHDCCDILWRLNVITLSVTAHCLIRIMGFHLWKPVEFIFFTFFRMKLLFLF